jgi:hypothetical protein
MATVPGTLFPDASASVNVSCCPAFNESIVAGFIGWLKVAVGDVLVTIFLLLLMLVGTLVASLLGLVDITAGAVCAIRLLLKPPAHPARSTAIKEVRDLTNFPNLYIYFPLLIRAGSGTAIIASPSAYTDIRFIFLGMSCTYMAISTMRCAEGNQSCPALSNSARNVR